MENKKPQYNESPRDVRHVPVSPSVPATPPRPPLSSFSTPVTAVPVPSFSSPSAPRPLLPPSDNNSYHIHSPSPSRNPPCHTSSPLDPKYATRLVLTSPRPLRPASVAREGFILETPGYDTPRRHNHSHESSSKRQSMSSSMEGNVGINRLTSPSLLCDNDYSLSPSVRRRRVDDNPVYHADRFIPRRRMEGMGCAPPSPSSGGWANSENSHPNASSSESENGGTREPLLHKLLRNELLGDGGGQVGGGGCSSQQENVLQFQSPKSKQGREEQRWKETSFIDLFHPGSVSPLTQSQLRRARQVRKIPSKAYKILDAPGLTDNFYSDLLDWSSQNIVAVGLSSTVYLYSPKTSQVSRLANVTATNSSISSHGSLTSLSWARRGNHLATGTSTGHVQIWDVSRHHSQQQQQHHNHNPPTPHSSYRHPCSSLTSSHRNRIATLSWNGPLLASGSRDGLIHLRDLRVTPHRHSANILPIGGLQHPHHQKEVCGLEWNWDGRRLASGGDDNILHVWDMARLSSSSGGGGGVARPLCSFDAHTAAVKALAWSPHHHGVLASGGGTADGTIRFWNTLTGTPKTTVPKPVYSATANSGGVAAAVTDTTSAINSSNGTMVDAKSQVCRLAWRRHANEIVSTHGFGGESANRVVVWDYPSMTKVATLVGHEDERVLHFAMSPDESCFVTGAADETIRFWHLAPPTVQKSTSSLTLH